jgi:O-antigen ligase
MIGLTARATMRHRPVRPGTQTNASTRRTIGPVATVAARTAADEPSLFVRFAFYAFVFSIPIEYPDRAIPLEVHTITGSLFLLVALLQPRGCFRRPPATFWLFAAYLWAYIAIGTFSEHIGAVIKLFFNYLLALFLFWTGFNLMRRGATAWAALFSFVVGCAVVALLNVLGIATKVVETDDTVRRIVFGQDANLLGGNMALGLVMLMALAFRPGGARGWLRLAVAVPVAALIGKSLMLAGSRGAIAGVAAGLIAFMMQTRDTRAFLRNAAIVLVAAAGLGVAISRSDSLLKRYQRTVATGSMSGREQLYPEAWRMFLERPLFGWGPTDNMYELGMRTAGFTIGKHNADGVSAKPDKDTHNLVLDVLTSMGLLGGLPLFLCLAGCVWSAWQARHGPRGTVPFALAAVVLMLSMDANWGASKQGWIVLAYAAASGSNVRARRRAGARTQGSEGHQR